MKSTLKKINFIPFTMALTLSLFSSNALAVVTSSQFTHTPPAITNSSSTKPLVMLVMGNDHQLFYKAYNDWSDLDGDSTIESTYKHDFDYYGYFDSYKCYDYDGVNSRFAPKTITANKYCTGASGSYWSGNFLNWASMTRMDIMRKVLYGGKRSTDTATSTILERAFLPTDAHSFAKFYDGSDIKDLSPFNIASITMCNTTYDSASGLESQNSTAAPLLRAASGDYRFWAANERWQCTWSTERTNATFDPVKATVGLTGGGYGPDYTVRVESCVSAALQGKENCKEYPDGNLKPTGLLHNYGETDQIEFGLLTGSYKKNKSGGVVRKDISSFTDEVNETTNGTYTGTTGIITTIDKLRIHGYEYSDGTDDGKYNSTDTCPWGESEFNEGNCSNWGNPATEMYLEAVRYFAGLNKNNAFSLNANDDTGYISGLTNVGSWTDPLSATNYCASCNIIILNTSDFSYDSDSLSLSGLEGSPTLDTYTDNVGVKEGLTAAGSTWFVGENGTDNNQLCTAKTVGALSDLKGSCPSSPRLEGSYHMAGIAHYAHTQDIRALSGDQKIQTYAVALSPSAPQLEIPVQDVSGNFIAGKTVNIIPACRDDGMVDLSGSSLPGNCAIVDFKVIVPFTKGAGGTATGTVAVIWEDTEQGGDYDQDMGGTIKYDITPTSITVTTDVLAQSTSFQMGFGYIIGGSTDDGFHAHSGINSFLYNDPNALLADCNPACIDSATATAQTYTIGTSTGQLLKDPLFYAAKWGGFTDLDGDGEPSNILEYDSVINSTGAVGSDSIPDNYFLSQDPSQVETQLNKVLSQISNRRSAGSAAAVITNTVTSTSMVVQGLYQPEIKSLDQTQTVQWAGFLHTLLLDKELNFREDADQDGQLDSYATDKVIKFFYDVSQNRTRVQRFNTSDGKTLVLDSVGEIDDVKTLWDAKRELNEMSSAALTTNRTYTDANNLSTNTNSQRYIFTWLDADNDGEVDSGESSDFVTSSFSSSNYGYFHLQADKDGDSDIDLDDAQLLVDFIRGVDDSNLRNRTIDSDGDGTNEVWRLGDIIHSSPAIVEKPTGIWRTQYGDTTYDAFTTQYSKRRSVVYVGANDGLLHAFNSGFFDTANKKYDLTRAAVSPHESSAPASHKLGAEIWAYAPKNLLPHMQWLSEPNYPNHVYYVDGDLKTFDVNIFPNDTDHPNGWGTILVATMRFGGGSNDGTNSTSLDIDVDGDSTADFTSRSSIIIMDITNPEAPPKLLAEFNDTSGMTEYSNLGLTVSTPELVSFRQPNLVDGDWSNPSVNDWYLVFGSGPTDLTTLLSTQTANVITLKLNDIDSGTITVIDRKPVADSNSYVGKMHTVDWTNNFITDNVYFGISSGSSATAPSGYLARMGTSTLLEEDTSFYNTTNWSISTVIDSNQPFYFKPTTLKISGKNWVYAGTGRRFITGDDLITNTQSYYGIKEILSVVNGLPDSTKTFSRGASAATLTGEEIQNVTGLQIFANYTVLDPLTSLPSSPVITLFSQLESYLNTVPGWYRDWATVSSLNERVNADTQSFSQQLLITTFQPSAASCTKSGTTNFYSLYNKTGTAHPGAGFGEDSSVTNSGSNLVTDSTSYDGENFGNVVCIGNNCGIVIQGSGDGAVDTEKGGSTGGGTVLEGVNTTPGAEGRQSWREIYVEEEF